MSGAGNGAGNSGIITNGPSEQGGLGGSDQYFPSDHSGHKGYNGRNGWMGNVVFLP